MMISKNDLRRVVIFGRLTDEMLQRLLPIVSIKRFEERQAIFHEGDLADSFYVVKSGKVLLEQRLTPKMTVSIDSIKPGYSFGWSAMLSGSLEPYSRYTSDAICGEACEAFTIPGEDFKELLEADHTMGYFISQRLNRVIRQRLVHRTEQFLRLIRKHPDIHALID